MASESACLCEIDAEAIAAALVCARHLGRGMAELLLHVAFVDLGRGGEAGPQRMAGKEAATLAFRQVAALDEASDP